MVTFFVYRLQLRTKLVDEEAKTREAVARAETAEHTRAAIDARCDQLLEQVATNVHTYTYITYTNTCTYTHKYKHVHVYTHSNELDYANWRIRLQDYAVTQEKNQAHTPGNTADIHISHSPSL